MPDQGKLSFKPPTWKETDALLARPFFESDAGQKFLKVLAYRKPSISATGSDERRTQHEKKEGWELCIEEIIHMLDEQKETNG
jgi:hypothetical protein